MQLALSSEIIRQPRRPFKLSAISLTPLRLNIISNNYILETHAIFDLCAYDSESAAKPIFLFFSRKHLQQFARILREKMESLIACHECDLIHRIKPLPKKGLASCIRCGAVLYRHKPDSLERTLSLTLAGLILFLLANWFPFLALKMGSQMHQTNLITGIEVEL